MKKTFSREFWIRVLLLLLGGTVGLGTLICAFVVGPAAQLFMPLSRRLVEVCLSKGAR